MISTSSSLEIQMDMSTAIKYINEYKQSYDHLNKQNINLFLGQ